MRATMSRLAKIAERERANQPLLSEDLDFFLTRELESGELRPLTRSLVAGGVRIDEQQVGPRRTLLLYKGSKELGRIDFAFYPYDPIARRERWRGLVVESLLDMTVNKLQALLTRFRPRDFVDLYFLLREGPEPDLDRLLDFVATELRVERSHLLPTTRLQHDLGVDGDDGYDLLIAFSTAFYVELKNIDFTRYFGPETGPNPLVCLWWLVTFSWPRPVPIMLLDLQASVNAGHWVPPSDGAA